MSVCEEGSVIQISAGPHKRTNTVVNMACEGECNCAGGHTLYEIDDGGNTTAELPAQCQADEMTFIIPQMAAGEVKHYKLGPATEAESGVAIEEQDGQLDFLISGQLFTSRDCCKSYLSQLRGADFAIVA